MSTHEHDATIDSRSHRIRQVVDDVIGRRATGEAVADEEVVSAHTDLMPELAEALGAAAAVRHARHAFGMAGRDDQATLSSDDGAAMPSGDPLADLDFADHGQDDIPVAYPKVDGYQIIGKLGQGGMGTVYRAIQLAAHREVALKLMSGRSLGSDKARRRFEREVDLAANLEHPHIARVYDSGVRRGVYYYAMRLVPGVPLDKYVHARDLAQEPRKLLDLYLLICRAVEFAHRKGVIHRDLKPSNIVVSEDGEPSVLDFGLAKTLLDDRDQATLSQEGDVTGTPAFMSPEQAAGKVSAVDTRSDVYSLGVILFLLMTGEHPHDTTGSTFEITRRIIDEEPRRPRTLQPTLDRDLEAVLLKCLEKDPAKRYGSAGGLADEIDRFLKGDPVTAQPATATYFLRKKLIRHKAMVTAAAVLFLIFNAAVGFYFWSIKAEQRRTEKMRQDAVYQAGVAKNNAANAELQRTKAVAQAQRATKAEADAKARLGEATRNLYISEVRRAQQLYREGMITQAVATLDRCPPQLRHWEWHYLQRVCNMPRREIKLASWLAQETSFNADGTLLGVTNSKGWLQVFDLTDGGHGLNVIQQPAEQFVENFRFAPVGTLAAVVRRGGVVEILDASDWKVRYTFAHDDTVKGFSFDPKAERLACRTGDRLVIWDLHSGVRIADYHVGNDVTGSVVCLREHRALMRRKMDLVFFDTDSGQWGDVIKVGIEFWGIVVSPDESTAYLSERSGHLTSIDLASGDIRYRIRPQTMDPLTAVSPDGRYVATRSRTVLKLHDAATGRMVFQFQNMGLNLNHIAISQDHIAIPTDNVVYVWPLEQPPQYETPINEIAGIGRSALSDNGRWLMVTSNGSVCVWDRAIGRFTAAISKLGPSDGASLSTDGQRFIYSTLSREIISCDAVTGTRQWSESSAHDRQIVGHSVLIDPTGQRVVSVDVGGNIRVRNAATGTLVWQAKRPPIREDDWRLTSFDLIGDRVFVKDRAFFDVFDAAKGASLGRWGPYGDQSEGINVLAFSPDGQWVCGGHGNSAGVSLIDARTGTLLYFDRPGHDHRVRQIAWSPDSKRFATASEDGRVIVWEPTTGTPLIELNHGDPVFGVHFSEDGAELISTGGSGPGAIKVWTGAPANQVTPAGQPIDLLKFARGAHAASGGVVAAEGDAVRLTGVWRPALELPIAPYGSYEVTGQFERTTEGGPVALILPTPRGQVALELGHPTFEASGLNAVNDKGWTDGNPTVVANHRIVAGRRYDLKATVHLEDEDAHITVNLDGVRLIDWTGPQSRLSIWEGWRTSRADSFAIGVGLRGEVLWHNLQLTMLDGEARAPLPQASWRTDHGGWLQLSSGETVNLLPLPDLAKDDEQAGWSRTDTGLQSRGQANYETVNFPVLPDAGYDLDLTLTRRSGNRSLAVVLPVGATAVRLSVHRDDDGLGGLSMIDGQGPEKNGTGVVRPLTNGTPYRLHITVRRDAARVTVESTLDGQPFVKWSGDLSQLSNDLPSALPGRVALITYEDPFDISAAALTLVDDSALLPPQAARKWREYLATQWTDVLAKVAPEVGHFKVQSARKDDGLLLRPVTPGQNGRWATGIALPHAQDGYELVGSFTHASTLDFIVALPVGDRRCCVNFNATRNGRPVSGIEMINDAGVGQAGNDASVWSAPEKNRRYELRVVVRQRGSDADIAVELDGKPFTSWRGPIASLSLWPQWDTPTKGDFVLGLREGQVLWHELKVRPLPPAP